MRRLNIEKTNEEWIDKLCDALPYEEWGTYLMMLKNSSDFVNYSLSVFIEKIEAHELELVKIKKMNSANMPQDVSLYYKNSPAATNVQSPKIQTGFSADNTSSVAPNAYPSSQSTICQLRAKCQSFRAEFSSKFYRVKSTDVCFRCAV